MILFARVQNSIVINVEMSTVTLAANDPELIKCPEESVLPDGSFNAAFVGSIYDPLTNIFTPPPMQLLGN